MSAGHARAAILGMLRLPRPVRAWARWQWAIAILTLAFVPRLIGRTWTWVLLAVAMGVGLGLLPLFGVLGFELSLAAAVLAAPMSLDVGSALARQLQRGGATGIARADYAGRVMVRGTLAAVGLTVAIALVPGVICAVRGIVVPTCDWRFGIESYVLMPVATALLGGALGFALGTLAGPRRFAGAALAQLPIVIVAAAALWRFYSAPPVFTYNAILGYFPGNLYDENVQLTWAFVWSRLEQLAWVIGVVALVACVLDVPTSRAVRAARPAGRRVGPIAIALVAGLCGGLLRFESSTLGYAIDADDIATALGGRFETPHFIIYYAKTPEIEQAIGVIAEDHEFRYAQVVAQLGVEPHHKLRSFYFADRDQKGRWFGARDVEMAKPWRGEIYLDHRSFPHGSLRHEIAHAIAAEFGDPIFGVATHHGMFAPGLIEGLAVAIDWPGGYERLTPHEAVRTLQAMGKRPSIAQLLSLEFFTVSSATGYTTAGSFLRYLLDTYGAPHLREVYGNGGDFTAAYGKPLAALENEWLAMIQTIQLPAGVVDASRERFRGGSVFDRPCAHAIAKRHEEANDAAAAGDRRRAIVLMRDVCGDAPEEPRFQLGLGDLLIGGDPMEHAEALGRWTSISRDLEGVTSSLRAEALDRLAHAAAGAGDLTRTRALVAEAVRLPVDDNQHRQLEAYAFALGYAGPAAAALRGYFFPGAIRIDPAVWALFATLAEPRLGVGHYLLGLQDINNGELVAGSAELQRALALGLPSLAFVKNGARKLAVAAYRVNDTTGMSIAIAALSGGAMSETDRLLAKDWLERIAFDAK